MPLCLSGGICEGGKVRIGVTSYSMLNLNVEWCYICFDLQVFSLIVFSISYTLKYTVSRCDVVYAA